MLRVENVKVYDLAESIVASGYAMGLNIEEFVGQPEIFEKWLNHVEDKPITESDSKENWLRRFRSCVKNTDFDKACSLFRIKDENDKKELQIALKNFDRIIRLVNASRNGNVKCHHNFMTGIRVSFDLIYPNYISPEMQRYHWFDIVTSSSKMHRIMKMDFDKCCNEYVTEETKENMKKYIEDYNRILNTPVSGSLSETDKHSEELYKAFMKVVSNCPQGVELFMRISTNYMQLQTMYFQRQNHRLKEDWGNFCKFIESLPMAEELIMNKCYD